MIFNLLQAGTEIISDSTKVELGEKLSELAKMEPSELVATLGESLVKFSLKVVVALLIYALGMFLIKRIKKATNRIFEKRNVEISLRKFLTSIINVLLIILLIVTIIGILGINTTSFAALLASGGVAIGLAVSGTMQNFAGGIMILAFKPFKIGDYIEAQGYAGVVSDISITSTVLKTTDNKAIILPNGSLSNGTINNYSACSKRRVDWKISISYGDDFEKAQKLLLELLNSDKRVLSDPAPVQVVLGEMADSAVVIYARAWVNSGDYWDVYFDYNKKFYEIMPENGFTFPFPQIQIHHS